MRLSLRRVRRQSLVGFTAVPERGKAARVLTLGVIGRLSDSAGEQLSGRVLNTSLGRTVRFQLLPTVQSHKPHAPPRRRDLVEGSKTG